MSPDHLESAQPLRAFRVCDRNGRPFKCKRDSPILQSSMPPLSQSNHLIKPAHTGPGWIRTSSQGIMSLPVTGRNASRSKGSCDSESPLTHPLHRIAETDPDLDRIVAAWSELPGPVKAGIIAMVEAARTLPGIG